MAGPNNSCTHCKCPWNKHMLQAFEYVKVKVTHLDLKPKELETMDHFIQQSREKRNAIRQTLAEYQQEFQVIQEVCAKLAYILANSAGTVSRLRSF